MHLQMRETAAKARESEGFAARASRMAARWGAEHWRGFAVAGVAGVFMAIIGAFGTIEAPLLHRLLYWAPTMLGGALFGTATSRFVGRPRRIGDNPWLLWAAVSVAVSIPITVFVWLYTDLLFNIPSGALLYLFPNVLIVSAVMTAIMMLVYRPGVVTHASAETSSRPPIRFMERLPPKLKGAAIYAISAEDHYLRLHTSKGSDLILMRLSDAIAELEGVEGAQTHRSWWVAKDAVEGNSRDGERIVLRLKGGAEAPVSRPNVRPLREAGWF